MKSTFDQALEVGQRMTREEIRGSRMAYVLKPRFQRLVEQLSLEEINQLQEQLEREFPGLRRSRERREQAQQDI